MGFFFKNFKEELDGCVIDVNTNNVALINGTYITRHTYVNFRLPFSIVTQNKILTKIFKRHFLIKI